MEAIGIDEIIRKTVAEYRLQVQDDRTYRRHYRRREQEEKTQEHPSGTWVCPVCRNWYALDDGTRVCTHDKSGTCKCSDMPAGLRRIRDLALLRRSLGSDPERTEAFERIVEDLYGKR